LNRQPPVKILLAKLNHLGDTLLLTPTIHFLKERFPEAEIDALVRAGCEEVLRGNPDVHQIFSVGHPGENQFLRNPRGMMLKRYDYAFDLSDSGRAKLWILLSAARMRGINDAYHSVGWQRCLFNRISVFEWRLQHQVLRDFRTVTDIMELKGEPGTAAILSAAGIRKPAQPDATRGKFCRHPSHQPLGLQAMAAGTLGGGGG
jgi:heptosyltransferase-3